MERGEMTKDELKADMVKRFSMVSLYWLDKIIEYVWELIEKEKE